MGFLDLLKKKKEVLLDESMDMPPAPPLGMGMEEPELPETDISTEEFPDISRLSEFKSKPSAKKEEKIMELPPIPEINEFEMPSEIGSKGIREELYPGIPTQRQIPPNIEQYNTESKEIKHTVKRLFLGIDNFKDVLDDIKSMKSDLNEFENGLTDCGHEEKECNSLYTKWEHNLKDIQRKLKFIDHILFKG
ncbi:MAG: hypothetical protein ABIJ08_00865 [Nanoarchaeota archaeon]